MAPSVSIRALKAWARKELPGRSVLQEVILAEANELSAEVFISRIPLYLRLPSLENEGSR